MENNGEKNILIQHHQCHHPSLGFEGEWHDRVLEIEGNTLRSGKSLCPHIDDKNELSDFLCIQQLCMIGEAI